jgi:hypothetical protein
MANRNFSIWMCRNKEARDRLIKFVEINNEYGRLEIQYDDEFYGDRYVMLNWDQGIYRSIIEDFPLTDYYHYRSDEFANFFYGFIGNYFCDGMRKHIEVGDYMPEWDGLVFNGLPMPFELWKDVGEEYLRGNYKLPDADKIAKFSLQSL